MKEDNQLTERKALKFNYSDAFVKEAKRLGFKLSCQTGAYELVVEKNIVFSIMVVEKTHGAYARLMVRVKGYGDVPLRDEEKATEFTLHNPSIVSSSYGKLLKEALGLRALLDFRRNEISLKRKRQNALLKNIQSKYSSSKIDKSIIHAGGTKFNLNTGFFSAKLTDKQYKAVLAAIKRNEEKS